MFNNENNSLNKNKQSNLKRSSDEYEEEYEYIEANAATGDQYRKFSSIRSKDGKITPEMVREFHNNSAKEAKEFKLNNPEVRNITFRELRDEDGNQVVKILHGGQLVFPSEFRVKVYDENGREIFGEENIRREIVRREKQWEKWEEEGQLKVIDHEIHDFSDGSVVSIYFRVPPVKTLHQNEINDITSPIGNLNKKLKAGDRDATETEVDYSFNNSQQSNRALIENIKQNIKDWKIDKILISKGSIFSSGKLEIRLFHREVSMSYDKNGNLIPEPNKIYHPDFFSFDEWNEIGQAFNNWRAIKKKKLKEYNKLSKSELIDLLIEVEAENNRLKKQIEELKSLPQQSPEICREIAIKEAQIQSLKSVNVNVNEIDSNPKKKVSIFVFPLAVGIIFLLIGLVLYRKKMRVNNLWKLKQPKNKNQL